MSDSVWSILSGGSYGKIFTLYFDGSHNNQANKSGAGCIIRDNQGELVVAAAFNITEAFPDSCNVAIAEAVALRNGLKLAKDNNVSLSLIKGDSKEVIDHVLDCSRRPSKPPLSGIIQQIAGMITQFSPKIMLINRDANKAADKLAFWGSVKVPRGGQIFRTYADLPPQVAELVKQEMSGSSSKEDDEGEGSSIARNIGMAGAAVAGVAMLAWGVSKLFSESSSDQNEHNKITSLAKALPTSDFPTHNSYASTYHENKTSNHHNYYILHFNGSDINQYNKGGAGCIIRNKEGKLLVAGAYNLDYLSEYPKKFHVAIAGAVALRNGMKLAEQKNVKLHLIKGKNEEVINRVLGRQKRPPEVLFLSELIDEIKQALYKQTIDLETQVKFIGEGEDNEVAHELANYGSNMLEVANKEIYLWEDDLPPKVAQLLQQDKNIWRAQKFLM